MKLEGSPTATNLREAFAREAQATLRYLYFARRADVEGEAGVAALLRALTDGEAGHGFGHLEFLEEVADPLAGGGDTPTNLESAAAEAETDAEAYAGYADAARADGFTDIADWFTSVAAAERSHARQLRKAIAGLDTEG